jgi:hypothetical protein
MQRNDDDPLAFIASVDHETRRSDAEALLDLMNDVTGDAPAMWGKIVGWGSYHYHYKSGREGDFCRVGFAPNKSNLSFYGLQDAPEAKALLPKLGKHRAAVGCVYVNKLADVDLDVLRELIRVGWAYERG